MVEAWIKIQQSISAAWKVYLKFPEVKSIESFCMPYRSKTGWPKFSSALNFC